MEGAPKKDDNFSEWFTWICNQEGADLADIRYGVQGLIVHKPNSFKVLRKIYQAFEDEVEKDGHEPLLFPTMIPKKNLEVESEHAGFTPEVFWVTKIGEEQLEEPLALRPTGESAFYPMFALWIRSYKDLPFKTYQSRMTVFRAEKQTRPFLRGREFMFFETHDVFETHKDAIQQIETDLQIMQKAIYDRMHLPFIFFQRPQWDKFKGADDTFCADTIMPDGRRSQLSSTHDLGQRFAKAYDVKFRDKDENEKLGWQTCFGPGIWRIFAALVAIHGDDRGLVLPFDFAPMQVAIIPITFSKKKDENKGVIEACAQVAAVVKKMGYRCVVDTSEETPGFKYNKWERLGVPIRIEIGPEEVRNNTLTIVRRTSTEKNKTSSMNIESDLSQSVDRVESDIRKKADAYFRDNTKEAMDFDDLKGTLEVHRGFVKIPFCSMGMDGQGCAEKIKEETGASVCGIKFGDESVPDRVCAVCKKKAKHFVYVAKSY